MKDDARNQSFERLLGSTINKSRRDGADGCPDPETVAAWVEGGLQVAERRRIEAHLAACAFCQAHVAAMARSEPVPEPTPARAPFWLSWRWLVPAAVGSLMLAVWMLGRPAPPPAERAAPAAPMPAESAAERKPVASPSASNVQSPAAAAKAPGASAGAVRSKAQSDLPPPSTLDRLAPERRDRAANELAKQDERAVRQERAAIPAPASSPPATMTVTAAQPAPPVKTNLPAEPMAWTEIVSNDPAVRWRIRESEVERTVDGGATWTPQSSGTSARLSAGSSPSPAVCWIVGQRGAVLRSIDGRTWQAIAFPEAIDLVGIEANGPGRATVTAADARHFTTEDGGRTWK